MHELKLAVNLAGWRVFVRRKADKAFLPVEQRIFDRDAYTCHQEVINLDGNYTRNKLSNMITACCFCVQCLFLQSVGLDEMGGGQLIYLPEMSQADLNSFCHVLFCALGNSTGYQESAQSIYRSLKFRSQIVDNKFGSGTSNPTVFGQMVIEYQERFPDKPIEIMKDLRLLPAHTKFKVQLDAWSQAALKELEEEAGLEST
jgi:intracellular multiplication protein IcmJ